MPKAHKPRSGSMQFWPRVRSKRIYASVSNWNKKQGSILLGFAGYKAGMTHLISTATEKNKNYNVVIPTTIIECPPLKPLSLRFYKQTPYGSIVLTQIYSKFLDKELSRKIKLPKQTKYNIPKEFDEMRLVVFTQPKLTNIGKKKPEIFEIGLNTDLESAKQLLEKEIKVSEVLKIGQFVDARAITKGKGFQGPVKRFGVSLKSHKSEKKRRAVGNLGPTSPRKVHRNVPQTGQMGFHQRTDYNKLILKIGSKPEEINQKGGIKRYGLVNNDYLLVKGSIPGPRKRLIMLTAPIRGTKDTNVPEITYISQESKQ